MAKRLIKRRLIKAIADMPPAIIEQADNHSNYQITMPNGKKLNLNSIYKQIEQAEQNENKLANQITEGVVNIIEQENTGLNKQQLNKISNELNNALKDKDEEESFVDIIKKFARKLTNINFGKKMKKQNNNSNDSDASGDGAENKEIQPNKSGANGDASGDGVKNNNKEEETQWSDNLKLKLNKKIIQWTHNFCEKNKSIIESDGEKIKLKFEHKFNNDLSGNISYDTSNKSVFLGIEGKF